MGRNISESDRLFLRLFPGSVQRFTKVLRVLNEEGFVDLELCAARLGAHLKGHDALGGSEPRFVSCALVRRWWNNTRREKV